MAVRGKPLDVATIRAILRLTSVRSIRETARELGVDRNTVRKYLRPVNSGVCMTTCDHCSNEVRPEERYAIGVTQVGRKSAAQERNLCQDCLPHITASINERVDRFCDGGKRYIKVG